MVTQFLYSFKKRQYFFELRTMNVKEKNILPVSFTGCYHVSRKETVIAASVNLFTTTTVMNESWFSESDAS